MTRPTSIPQHIWETLSNDAQVVIAEVIDQLEQRIADLEERLNKNSTNSSKPPSSDPPSVKRRPPAMSGPTYLIMSELAATRLCPSRSGRQAVNQGIEKLSGELDQVATFVGPCANSCLPDPAADQAQAVGERWL